MELIISSAVAVAISLGYTKFKCAQDFQKHITTQNILIERINKTDERLNRFESELPNKMTKMLTPIVNEVSNLKHTVGV